MKEHNKATEDLNNVILNQDVGLPVLVPRYTTREELIADMNADDKMISKWGIGLIDLLSEAKMLGYRILVH